MAQTQTDGIEVLETREWLDSLDYVLSKGGPDRAGRLLQQLALHARREAGVNLPFTATTPYQNSIPPRHSLRSRAARRWSGGSRAWCAGMRSPWSCAPTRSRKASAATSLLSLRRRRYTKLHSITSCTPVPKKAIATSFISRATQPRASIPGRFWKAGCRKRNWKTFAAN